MKQKQIFTLYVRKESIDKRVLCRSCCFPIKRKCFNLKTSYIFDLTRKLSKWHWEYSIYISVKFPFGLADDKELIRGNFNSNYHCKCLTTSENEAGYFNMKQMIVIQTKLLLI